LSTGGYVGIYNYMFIIIPYCVNAPGKRGGVCFVSDICFGGSQGQTAKHEDFCVSGLGESSQFTPEDKFVGMCKRNREFDVSNNDNGIHTFLLENFSTENRKHYLITYLIINKNVSLSSKITHNIIFNLRFGDFLLL
jgi:hypothetical protein